MFLTAFVFFIILSILVLIHELGHFAIARLIGVHVEEFGFGLPPRIFGKKIKGTIYSINWLPIGGFVKLAGEDEDYESLKSKPSKNTKKLFWARSKKERTAILLAGVIMNFILAVGITTYLLTQGTYETAGRIHIEKIVAGSPADKAGLKVGDILIDVSEYSVSNKGLSQIHHLTKPSDLIGFTGSHKGQKIRLTVIQGDTQISVVVTPRIQVPKGEGPLGVAISDLEIKTYQPVSAIFQAILINITRARDMLAGISMIFVRLAHLKPVGNEVAGPIGIAQVTGEAVKFGFKAILEFMSILSLNLAVLNVLPIPALDGGRVLFVFIEKLIGRKIRPAFERSTHQAGMIFLFILIILISVNDILRLARGG